MSHLFANPYDPGISKERRIVILKQRIRLLLGFFIAALTVSGITAIPLEVEIGLLNRFFGRGTFMDQVWPAMAQWVSFIHQGLTQTAQAYPFVFYGTDWLAFGHLAIAIAFIGPWRDPVKNLWVVEFGLIACVLVIPMALIFGPIRGIPFFWQVIDTSFGIFGLVPLLLARRYILAITVIEASEQKK